MEIFALINMINGSFYMLQKIIKTHTARLNFVDIIKPTFLRNAVATNRQRRVIASSIKYCQNLSNKKEEREHQRCIRPFAEITPFFYHGCLW